MAGIKNNTKCALLALITPTGQPALATGDMVLMVEPLQQAPTIDLAEILDVAAA